nr:probable receptor-like protein kinase At1g49730 isoform X1 [Tanacetum cinerariifolium]
MSKGCPLDITGSNITRAAVICSDTEARASCCRYINALVAVSIARYANTTNNLGVSPELSNVCLQTISETLVLRGMTRNATAFCGFGTKISVNYECLGKTTVDQMQQSPKFSNVTLNCRAPLGEGRCRKCLNAGILHLRNLVGAGDNTTLSTCRDATFVAVASRVDNVPAIQIADCFFGVHGLSNTESSPSPFAADGPSQLSLTVPDIRHHSYHLSLVPGLGIAVTAVAAMLVVLMVFLIRRKNRELDGHNMTSDKTSMKAISQPAKKFQEGPSCMFKKFTYKETKRATDNFGTVIGEGGFGTVFRAQFSDGSTLAVKRMNKVSDQAVEEFCREIELLARLHHRVRPWRPKSVVLCFLLPCVLILPVIVECMNLLRFLLAW